MLQASKNPCSSLPHNHIRRTNKKNDRNNRRLQKTHKNRPTKNINTTTARRRRSRRVSGNKVPQISPSLPKFPLPSQNFPPPIPHHYTNILLHYYTITPKPLPQFPPLFSIIYNLFSREAPIPYSLSSIISQKPNHKLLNPNQYD